MPALLHTFDCGIGGVLALTARGDTVYAGCQDGVVKVWDLETRTLVRTLMVVEVSDKVVGWHNLPTFDFSECRHSVHVDATIGPVCLLCGWQHSGALRNAVYHMMTHEPLIAMVGVVRVDRFMACARRYYSLFHHYEASSGRRDLLFGEWLPSHYWRERRYDEGTHRPHLTVKTSCQ